MSRHLALVLTPIKRKNKAHAILECGENSLYLGCLDGKARARLAGFFDRGAERLRGTVSCDTDHATQPATDGRVAGPEADKRKGVANQREETHHRPLAHPQGVNESLAQYLKTGRLRPEVVEVALEQLREIEWATGTGNISDSWCLACDREIAVGHAPDCWLAAKIREAEASLTEGGSV